ncbi:MAG: hypothetical protein FJX67_00270 [Alphaproteobacteria bacterium]|nr:hypothetical protein [Alphaproteobacteria bacterium]
MIEYPVDQHKIMGTAITPPNPFETTRVAEYFQAIDNFNKVFAIRPSDKVVFLSDPLIDPRVFHAIRGLCRARGVQPDEYMRHDWNSGVFPDELKQAYEKATFVVTTWFASIGDDYCLKVRRDTGQRSVKITYFRNLDMLKTPQARFPVDLVGEIIRATRDMYPENENFELKITDPRGSDWRARFTPDMRNRMLDQTRWRGHMTADEPGAYVHWLPTHGPNVYDRQTKADKHAVNDVEGVFYPQWAVGFPEPFKEKIAVIFEKDKITRVEGRSKEAEILRDMLVGGVLQELGCGFNPKAPRTGIYPAGSNNTGALHWGIELAKPSEYVKKVIPHWEEPPVHMDLISLDSTVTAGNNVLIRDGFLTALRTERVIKAARQYGEPIELLEAWPD